MSQNEKEQMDQLKKEHLELNKKLQQRQREFYFFKNLQEQKLLLNNKETEIILETQKRALHDQYEYDKSLKQRNFYTDDRFDKRLPLDHYVKEKYFENNKSLYEKITEDEQKDFNQAINKNRIYYQKQIQLDQQNIYKYKYKHLYEDFQEMQGDFDYNISQLSQNNAESLNLISQLKNMPSFDRIKIANQKELTEKQQQTINDYIEDRFKFVNQKYPFIHHQDDITEQVDEYIKDRIHFYQNRVDLQNKGY